MPFTPATELGILQLDLVSDGREAGQQKSEELLVVEQGGQGLTDLLSWALVAGKSRHRVGWTRAAC